MVSSGSLSPELSERTFNTLGHITPRASQDVEPAEQITMLKQEIVRLTTALERGEGATDGEIQKLRKANRVLEAHVDMLRSNLSAARSEPPEQAGKLEGPSQEGNRSHQPEADQTLTELRAELKVLRSQNKLLCSRTGNHDCPCSNYMYTVLQPAPSQAPPCTRQPTTGALPLLLDVRCVKPRIYLNKTCACTCAGLVGNAALKHR